MIEYFNKGQISKGSDVDIFVFLFPCFVNKETVSSLTCDFYTTSGYSVEKTQEDFEFSNNGGAVHLQAVELDAMDDGVLRYVVSYDYSYEDIVVDENTLESSTTIVSSSLTLDLASNFYLKSPVNYEPIDFVTTDEVNDIVESAFTSSSVTEYIDEIVEEAITPINMRVNPDRVLSGSGVQTQYAKVWDYFENNKSNFVYPYYGANRGYSRINSTVKTNLGWRFTTQVICDVDTNKKSFVGDFLLKHENNVYSCEPISTKWYGNTVPLFEYATSADTVSALTNIEYSLTLKQDELISGTNIKTIHGESILGAGNIDIVGPQGATGAQGAQGERGPEGVQGAQGERGPEGAQGAQGERGPEGAQGAQGERGPEGAQGAQGERGPEGAQGAQGERGPEGAQGAQGERGPEGAQGAQGERGPEGAQGAQGERGPEGAQGAQGERGPEGAQGAQGERGPEGAQGAQGERGPEGAQGAQGERGPEGAQGAQGERGPEGAQGAKGDTGEVDYSRLSGYTTTSVTADLSAVTSGLSIQVQTLQASAVTSTTTRIIWNGTKQQYEQISTKDPNTMYVITP